MMKELPMDPHASCATCPVGSVAGVAKGHHCPLVDRRRPAGTLLYVVGEPIDTIWYLKSGSVVLSRAGDDKHGEGTPWAVRRAGSFLGLEGLVRTTYLDSARALTDVTLCGAVRSELTQWVGSTDNAARMLLEAVLMAQCADTPRRTNADGSALQRVASWLLDDATRTAMREVPRRVVAGLLGMQPETLSRCLAELSERGALKVTRRTIEVANWQLLLSTANGG